MNTILPAGIESYLKEAGFSSTEMLVLRKLLEEESLTVRELASKTGKSTGILDQAMKKLLTKRIAIKGTINGQPRYSIQSLDSISKWVKEDMQERKNTLERRQQNFESFLSSLKLDRSKPDIEHFSGPEGIEQAYLRLLEENTELLTITPITTTIEDDPLRDLRVDLFRKRQVRKIFQRVLAPDTPLARRFQSRDPFEYRKTLLVPEDHLPVTFEKIITPSLVACFNHDTQSACFLKYPDLAHSERLHFESLWNRTKNPENPAPVSPTFTPTIVPLLTRTLSSLREFILSPRSIIALTLFALLSAVLTFGLYQSNRNFNLQRIRDKVSAIAATGALQFNPSDILAIRTKEDISKPEYAKLVSILNTIKLSNEDIAYVYLMRKTEDPTILSFIAEGDSFDPRLLKDLNHDGLVNEKDSFIYPGDTYEISSYPYIADGFSHVISDPNPTTDAWGTFVSGYAPVKNAERDAIAMIGVDMFIASLEKNMAESFSPFAVFGFIFGFFALLRYYALNRSLVVECLQCIFQRKSR